MNCYNFKIYALSTLALFTCTLFPSKTPKTLSTKEQKLQTSKPQSPSFWTSCFNCLCPEKESSKKSKYKKDKSNSPISSSITEAVVKKLSPKSSASQKTMKKDDHFEKNTTLPSTEHFEISQPKTNKIDLTTTPSKKKCPKLNMKSAGKVDLPKITSQVISSNTDLASQENKPQSKSAPQHTFIDDFEIIDKSPDEAGL